MCYGWAGVYEFVVILAAHPEICGAPIATAERIAGFMHVSSRHSGHVNTEFDTALESNNSKKRHRFYFLATHHPFLVPPTHLLNEESLPSGGDCRHIPSRRQRYRSQQGVNRGHVHATPGFKKMAVK